MNEPAANEPHANEPLANEPPANEASASPSLWSDQPMIDPHGDIDDVISDVPELTLEEVEKRIGARERARQRRIATATPARIRTAPSNRRVILWRDSATILVFVVLALLAARFLLPSNSGLAQASPTPEPTLVVIGTEPADTGFHFSAPPTIGPPVDPSNRINASPTPIPVITLGPPTPKPSKTPGPGVTPAPGTTPTPAPTAAPKALFSLACTGTDTGHFDAHTSTAGTGATITSYEWAWDDGTSSTLGVPLADHTFVTSGSHSVILTIHTSTGGQASISHLLSACL